jgi:hypothetical protein
MNTPPKIRRYKKPPARRLKKSELMVGVIDDREVTKAFTDVMTSFVYLEQRMASVLAVLLGDSDTIAAAFILDAIKSPSGRIDVMKDLLERAPANKKLSSEYDQIIREFRAISSERNTYAHGRWWTEIRSKETILDETDDPTTHLHVRRKVTAAELNALDDRMLKLHIAIHEGPEAELKKRQKAGLRPRRATTQGARPRRNAPK